MRGEVATWVAQMIEMHESQAPVLEVGSFDVNGSIRSLFPQDGYVGLDMRAGAGVDLVVDILDMPKKLRRKFNTVVTTETLEHITEPWRAVEQMYAALRPGGLFIGTWVFAWGIHEYPSDYWRGTPAGFDYLLRRVGFENIQVVTQGGDEAHPIGIWAVARKKGLS